MFMRRVNGWLTIFWVAMIRSRTGRAGYQRDLRLCAFALGAVSGHWSAWQAARVEVTQPEEEKAEAEDPVEQRVVEKIIERTEVDPAPEKTETIIECSERTRQPQKKTAISALFLTKAAAHSRLVTWERK